MRALIAIGGIRECPEGVKWEYQVRYYLRSVEDEDMEETERPYVQYDKEQGRQYIQCASCETRFYDGQWMLAEELMRICQVCGRTFCHKCAYEIELWDEMQICKECLNEREN